MKTKQTKTDHSLNLYQDITGFMNTNETAIVKDITCSQGFIINMLSFQLTKPVMTLIMCINF